MNIDLRSDTVTRPTPAMLAAMGQANVGDDVFEEDPTVNELEDKLARMFKMEAGLFCPSGTMTNQIAIRLFTQPQHEVVCDKLSHIHNYEGGGVAYNSLATTKLLDGENGILNAQQIEDNINPDNIHFPVTSLVSLENTVNKGGGNYYTLPQIEAIKRVCTAHNLYLHMDGARIFNALVETHESTESYGPLFDSISICLSKGLGAPVGSVLLSSQANIKRAKRIRKVLGGGMRQAGYLAAAGIYALDHNIGRLREDHIRAQEIARALSHVPSIIGTLPVITNIIICNFETEAEAARFVDHLAKSNIKVGHFSKKAVRMVTHLDFDDAMLEKLLKSLSSF